MLPMPWSKRIVWIEGLALASATAWRNEPGPASAAVATCAVAAAEASAFEGSSGASVSSAQAAARDRVHARAIALRCFTGSLLRKGARGSAIPYSGFAMARSRPGNPRIPTPGG